jgi:hypothetical protein
MNEHASQWWDLVRGCVWREISKIIIVLFTQEISGILGSLFLFVTDANLVKYAENT